MIKTRVKRVRKMPVSTIFTMWLEWSIGQTIELSLRDRRLKLLKCWRWRRGQNRLMPDWHLLFLWGLLLLCAGEGRLSLLWLFGLPSYRNVGKSLAWMNVNTWLLSEARRACFPCCFPTYGLRAEAGILINMSNHGISEKWKTFLVCVKDTFWFELEIRLCFSTLARLFLVTAMIENNPVFLPSRVFRNHEK